MTDTKKNGEREPVETLARSALAAARRVDELTRAIPAAEAWLRENWKVFKDWPIRPLESREPLTDEELAAAFDETAPDPPSEVKEARRRNDVAVDLWHCLTDAVAGFLIRTRRPASKGRTETVVLLGNSLADALEYLSDPATAERMQHNPYDDEAYNLAHDVKIITRLLERARSGAAERKAPTLIPSQELARQVAAAFRMTGAPIDRPGHHARIITTVKAVLDGLGHPVEEEDLPNLIRAMERKPRKPRITEKP